MCLYFLQDSRFKWIFSVKYVKYRQKCYEEFRVHFISFRSFFINISQISNSIDIFPIISSKITRLENCSHSSILNFKCVKFEQNQRTICSTIYQPSVTLAVAERLEPRGKILDGCILEKQNNLPKRLEHRVFQY